MRNTLTTKELGILPLVLAGFLVLWGFGSAGLSILATSYGIVSTNTELPLGELQGVSIAADNLIFCGSGDYGRIQVYSQSGEFIRAINLRGRLLGFYINRQGIIRLRMRDGVQSHSVDGRFLGKIPKMTGTSDEFANIPEYALMDQQGNTYSVARNYWNFARVVRTTRDGQKTLVVSQPWYLWVIQWPKPAWYWGIFGVVLFAVFFLAAQRRKLSSNRSNNVAS